MSDIASIAARVATVTGTAAIALMLSSSAAFAQGDIETGRQQAEIALEMARDISPVGVIENDTRADLKAAIAAIPGRSTSYSVKDSAAKKERDRAVSAAADMAAAAGMASRGNDDAVRVLRAVLASTDDTLDADQRFAIMSKEIGLPIRLDDPSYKMHYEAL